MELNELGMRIAKSRIRLGITATELSFRIGKAASYIHHVETGKLNVSWKTLVKICEELGISLKELIS